MSSLGVLLALKNGWGLPVSEVALPGTQLFLARCEVRDVEMSLLRDIMEKIALLQQRLSEAEILVKGAAEALGESYTEVRLLV